MKTDYEKMGKEALERLAGTTADVRACQEAVLAEILDKNKDTVIGRKFGFSRIRTVEEYRKAVRKGRMRNINHISGECSPGRQMY